MTTERPQSEQEPQPNSRYIIPLNSLASEKYQLTRPIGVLIEDYGNEVFARIPEFDLTGHAEVEGLALNNLVDDAIELHEDLQGTSDDELGPLPKKWKVGLSQLITEITPDTNLRQIAPKEPLRSLVTLGKLADGLSLPADSKGSRYTLTPEMAEHFNKVIGGDLADEERLSPLLVPSKEEARRLPGELRDKLLAIDPKVKAAYNHALYPVVRSGILTAGDLRSTIEQGASIRNVGLGGEGFLKVAFERKS